METKRVEFAIEKRGYSPVQVDDYISFLLARCDELEKECAELKKECHAAHIKLEEAKSDENTISSIIVSAQKMADSIVKDAKDKAKAVSEALAESCDEMLNSYVEKVKIEREKLMKAGNAVAEFKDSLYSAYREHIASLDKIMPDEEIDSDMAVSSDDELMDEALELARKKYEEADSEEIDFISRQNSADGESEEF